VFSVISDHVTVKTDVQKKLKLFRMRQAFNNLKMFCLEESIKRIGNMQIAERMKLFIKRRVLKVLFNNVQVTKRIERLRVISAKMRDSQIIRHCLKTW